MTIIINNMNITEKIAQLNKEYSEQEKAKKAAHEKMKEIKSKIGKLQTISKHANELFEEKDFDDASTKLLHENMQPNPL